MKLETLPTGRGPAESGALSTEDFAAKFGVKAQSVRHALCQNGHYLGIRPIKLPNRLLRWPADAAAKILAEAGRAA